MGAAAAAAASKALYVVASFGCHFSVMCWDGGKPKKLSLDLCHPSTPH
jgi:hypothetical protein